MNTRTGWATEALALLHEAGTRDALPRVRRLHLPPPPEPGRERGEFCALELEDGALGLAYVLLGDTLAQLRKAMPPAARPGAADTTLDGADATALAQRYIAAPPTDTLARTLGFAAINALTRSVFDRAGFAWPRSGDSFGGLDPQPGETIGMIGHFAPLVGRIVARGARLVVAELRPELVRDDGTVRVTTDARELAGCTKVLATGTLLLNDSLDTMLAHCRGATQLALVGPSVGAPPDVLFARGITLLGGHWVHDTRGYCEALAHGEPTGPFAFKAELRSEGYPGWPALLARWRRGPGP